MRRACVIAIGLAVASGCGGAATPAKGPGGGAVVLEGVWADHGHTLAFRGDQYLMRERRQCARLPCASATISAGVWRRDGATLRLAAVAYDLAVEDGGEALVLQPADGGAALRLDRQRFPALAGTSWVDGPHSITFTSDVAFTREAPCDSCAEPIERSAGSWALEDGQLDLTWDGAEESFGLLYEDGALILIGATETLRLAPAPPR